MRLCNTPMFREEVLFEGDPHDAARKRVVQSFVGHAGGREALASSQPAAPAAARRAASTSSTGA